MIIQEAEYARKDFRNAVGALLSYRGIEVNPILAKGHAIQVHLNYRSVYQDSAPRELQEWISEPYRPRHVRIENIILGLSPNSDYGPHGRIINGITPWAAIDVITVGPQTEEERMAERQVVVVSDPEVFGLPVEHEVHNAEHIINWRGVILPDKNILIGRNTILALDEHPMVWRRSVSSLDTLAKDTPTKLGEVTVDAETLEISVVRSLIDHVLEVSKGGIYYTSYDGTKRNVSPKIKVEVY